MNIELSNKTILVTGGAGFIGSNLCEALLEIGNKVICLDNFATGKKENIEQLLKDINFTLIEGDIRKLEVCLKATKDVDYVLHQAALGSVPRSIQDPILSNEVNVSGFLNMLVAARDNRVKRFVLQPAHLPMATQRYCQKLKISLENHFRHMPLLNANELYADVFQKPMALKQ